MVCNRSHHVHARCTVKVRKSIERLQDAKSSGQSSHHLTKNHHAPTNTHYRHHLHPRRALRLHPRHAQRANRSRFQNRADSCMDRRGVSVFMAHLHPQARASQTRHAPRRGRRDHRFDRVLHAHQSARLRFLPGIGSGPVVLFITCAVFFVAAIRSFIAARLVEAP